MKSTVIFSVSEGFIKFCHASGGQKRNILGVDAFSVDQLRDEQITERLAALVKQRRLNFKDITVIIMIPRTSVILRPLTLPTQAQDELQAMIDLQVVNHIPYAREEVQIDFQVLEKTSDGYSKVLTVIIPQEVVTRYWKIFSNARIPVSRVTISSVGLWLLYKQQAAASSGVGAVIDMDQSQSEICLCHQDYWLNSREIPIGLKIVQEEGFGEFTKQWQLTLENKSQQKQQKPQLAYFINSNRMEPALLEELSKAIDCRVVELDAAQLLPSAKNIIWPQDLMGQKQSWAAIIGIALTGTLPPINLIPQMVRDEKSASMRRKEMIVCGVWGTLAVLLCGLALSLGVIRNNMRLEELDNALKEYQKDAKKVEARIAQVNNVENIFKNRVLMSGWIEEIYRLLPKSIVLVNISLTNSYTLSFQGTSSTQGDISLLQNVMTNSPIFANVNLDYVNKRITQEGELNYFKMTVEIKSNKGSDETTK